MVQYLTHKFRFYHVVLNTAPESLFSSEGFYTKENYNVNHSGKWIVFWDSNDSLGAAWDSHKVVSPPTFITKTEGLSNSEAKALVGSIADNDLESEGWLKGSEVPF